MPTYKNVLDKPVVIDSGFVVDSQAKIELPNYIESGLLKFVSDKPYYNPVAGLYNIYGPSEVKLRNWNNIAGVEIINTSDKVLQVYLTSEDNGPPITVPQNTVRYIWLNSSVKKLVITCSNGSLKGDVHITEIKDKNSIDLRGM
jgi:hypothetical protein